MLMDTGQMRDRYAPPSVPDNAERLAMFMRSIGLKQIDYLVISHFDIDHFEAAAALAQKVPIGTFVDHGDSIHYGRSEAWWYEYNRPWYRPSMHESYDLMWSNYVHAREKSKHLVVRPGEHVPINGVDALVVTSAGVVLGKPLEGAGQPNPACEGLDFREDVYMEDGQSVGLLISVGKFRFVNLGDLTWNRSMALFCPDNLIGKADVYVVTHHGQNLTRQWGDHFYGLSSCPPSEAGGLQPRVAFLTMGARGHTFGMGATPACMEALKGSSRMEGLWETNKVVSGAEKDYNPPDDFIANVGEDTRRVEYVKLSANSDGSFIVSNSRNGFKKSYPARE
jgi:competence protein ComEC